MKKAEGAKGVFFEEAPDAADFVNVADSLFTPQLDLINHLFNEMNESGNMKEPFTTIHNVVYGMIQTWEKICMEAYRLEAEKRMGVEMKIILTKEIAYAAGHDAGNASMRKAGRKRWNEEDWNQAAKVTNRLLDEIEAATASPEASG